MTKNVFLSTSRFHMVSSAKTWVEWRIITIIRSSIQTSDLNFFCMCYLPCGFLLENHISLLLLSSRKPSEVKKVCNSFDYPPGPWDCFIRLSFNNFILIQFYKLNNIQTTLNKFTIKAILQHPLRVFC